MKYVEEPNWGRYALETVYDRETAERRFAEWEERARAFPGAEVRVLTWKDPLGGETFLFTTNCLKLVPPAWRRPVSEVLARLEAFKLTASEEDREAIDLAQKALRGDFREVDEEIERLEREVRRLQKEIYGVRR